MKSKKKNIPEKNNVESIVIVIKRIFIKQQKQKFTIIKQKNITQKHDLQHLQQPKSHENEDFYKAIIYLN